MKKDSKFLSTIRWFLVYAGFICLVGLFAFCIYCIIRFSIFDETEITKLEAVTLTISILASVASTFVGGIAIYISVIQVKNNKIMNENLMEQNKAIFENQYKPLVVIQPQESLYTSDKSALFTYNIGFDQNKRIIIKKFECAYFSEDDFYKSGEGCEFIILKLLNPTKIYSYNFYIGLSCGTDRSMSDAPIVLGPNEHVYVVLILSKEDIEQNVNSKLIVTYQDVISYVYKQEFKIKIKDNHIAIETSAIRETIKDQNKLFE